MIKERSHNLKMKNYAMEGQVFYRATGGVRDEF